MLAGTREKEQDILRGQTGWPGTNPGITWAVLPGHWKSAGSPNSLPRAPLWYLYIAGCQLCEFGFKVLLLPLRRTHMNVPGHGGEQQTHPLDRKQKTPSLGGGFNAVNKAGGYHHPDLTKELRWECLGVAKPGRIWWLSLRLGPGPASSFLTPHSKTPWWS